MTKTTRNHRGAPTLHLLPLAACADRVLLSGANGGGARHGLSGRGGSAGNGGQGGTAVSLSGGKASANGGAGALSGEARKVEEKRERFRDKTAVMPAQYQTPYNYFLMQDILAAFDEQISGLKELSGMEASGASSAPVASAKGHARTRHTRCPGLGSRGEAA